MLIKPVESMWQFIFWCMERWDAYQKAPRDIHGRRVKIGHIVQVRDYMGRLHRGTVQPHSIHGMFVVFPSVGWWNLRGSKTMEIVGQEANYGR